MHRSLVFRSELNTNTKYQTTINHQPQQTMNLHTLPAINIACGIGLALTLTASAATIYEDSFPGLSTDGINGTTPSTTVGTNTWESFAGINADGSITAPDRTAILEFTPTSGQIYTATIGINFAAVGTSTNALQFILGKDLFAQQSPSNNGGRRMFTTIREDGSATSYAHHDTLDWWIREVDSAAIGTYNTSTATIDTVTMVLDTTAAEWTYQASINGTAIGRSSFGETF